ncbi:MAG: flagellar basal body-associated FliL family protein [Acetobacteraceae bacterium]
MASAATVEPADAATEAPAEGAETAPKSRRRLILMAAPVLLALAGGALWFSGLLPKYMGHAGGHGGAKAQAAGKPVLFAVPEMVANLAAPGGTERFVKLDISLVAASPGAALLLHKNLPQLQDLFLTYLRDMHASELQSSTGTWRLREALLSRAAVLLGPGQVTNVLFTKLLIQ